VILSYLFYGAVQSGQWQELRETPKHWGWVATGFFGCMAAMLFSFYRWQLLVRALDLPFRLVDSMRIGFIGLFFGLFAFGVVGNDSLRAYYAARQAKDRVSAAITSVLADRVIGLITMFTVGTIAFCSVDFSTLAASYPEKAFMFHPDTQTNSAVSVVYRTTKNWWRLGKGFRSGRYVPGTARRYLGELWFECLG